MADEALTAEPATIPLEVPGWHERHDDLIRATIADRQFDADVFDPLYREFRQRWPNWPMLAEEERAAAEAWSAASGYDTAAKRAAELAETACAIDDELMERPAPDFAALRWKLDKLMEIQGDGYTASWSGEYVKQTIADYHRLLDAEQLASQGRA